MGETRITVAQGKNIQVIGTKGKAAVYKMSSRDRMKLNAIVTCMSPAGQFVPGKKKESRLMHGALSENTAGYHYSGWIQCDLFC